MKSWGRLVVVTATICIGLIPARPAAAADTSIKLVSESATVPPDGSATFSIEVTDAPPESTIALDVYLPVDDRAAVAAAMQGKVRGQQFFPGLRLAVDTALGPDRRVTLTVPTSSDGRDGTFRLKTAGLYPVLISVQKGSTTLARLTTFLVRVDPTSRPVDIAMVFPVDRAPVLQPDGSRILDAATRARLNAIDRIGATAPTVPFTLAIRPDIIDTLLQSTAEDRALATRLAAIAKRGEIIIDTTVTMDPSLAARSGLSDIYQQQIADGTRILSGWVGSDVVDSGTRFSPIGLDRDGLKLARAGGLTTLVTLPTAVSKVGGDDPGPLGPVAITVPNAGTDSVPGVVGTGDFATLLGTRGEPQNAVNGFVAQLQALSPTPVATLPGVALVAPLDWSAEPGGPLDLLVTRLGSSGGLRPVTVQQFLRDVPTVKTPLTFREPPLVTTVDVGGQLALVNLGISALTSMMTTPPAQTAALLNVASSTALTDVQRADYIAAAKAPTAAMQTAIEPLEKQTFSVAAGKGAIPIRITSKLSSTPLKVKLHFSSARAEFVPNDQIVTIVDGLFQKDDMPIETRDGLYPVKLEVLTPDGDQLLATGVYDVQAIAYGGLGLALTAGAGLVLVTWWISHARRTRRRKRAAVDALRHPSRAATG